MVRRRGHNEGTIKERRYARKDGSERLYFQAFPPARLDGNRPSLGTFKTRKEAQDAIRKAMQETEDGVIASGKRPTFQEWARQYLGGRTRIAYSTRTLYASSFRVVEPYIGRIRIDELTEDHLRITWNRLASGLEPDGKTPRARGPLALTTLDRCHRHVAAALRAASDGRRRLISFNPASAPESRPEKGERKPIHPLSESEVHRLFDVTQNHREHPLWVFMITTGVRPGEARALQWSDIDWTRQVVSITKSVHQEIGRGAVTGPTKTNRNRVIKLRPKTVEALRRHRAAQAEMRLQAGPAWQDGEYVFTTDAGRPLDDRYMQRLFDRACSQAGVARRTLKETRHTFATLGLYQREPVKFISAALGHSSAAITLNVYSHVVADDRDSLAFLDSLFD